MALYVIGDLQGCYENLIRLLEHIEFDRTKDNLWFAGDLVNRGPDSLATLRYVKDLAASATTVLGNHDLHLLAMSQGNLRHAAKEHTLDAILEAPDRDELLHWLRQQPLMHHCEKRQFTLIHAGLPPQWSIKQALKCAQEVERVIRGDGFYDYCQQMYGNEPQCWSEALEGMDRLRFITNCFTRLRYCDKEGNINLKDSGPPGTQPPPYEPWFSLPNRRSKEDRIVFGHWSALGYGQHGNAWSIDSGCLWGGQLTALQIRKKKPPRAFQIECSGHRKPLSA